MNTKRILVGGLVAAVVIGVTETLLWGVVLADAMSAAQAENGLTEATWGGSLFLVTTIVLGLMLAWLYAVMRARFGPGPVTALKAGAFLWVATWVIYYVWLAPSGRGLLFLQPSLTTLALAWELAGVVLAALAAGWIYREE